VPQRAATEKFCVRREQEIFFQCPPARSSAVQMMFSSYNPAVTNANLHRNTMPGKAIFDKEASIRSPPQHAALRRRPATCWRHAEPATASREGLSDRSRYGREGARRRGGVRQQSGKQRGRRRRAQWQAIGTMVLRGCCRYSANEPSSPAPCQAAVATAPTVQPSIEGSDTSTARVPRAAPS